MTSKNIRILFSAISVMALTGCAARVITYEQQMLNEADSLFKAGNYEYAKVQFSKIKDSEPIVLNTKN